METTPIGTPFSPALKQAIDEWSVQVFELLCSWPLAEDGKWTRWDPGYLVLEISSVAGDEIEPIVLDTADEELTITFGYWEAHLPSNFETDAQQAVDEAKEFVRQWLCGEIRTAVFADASGAWCGSKLIEGNDLLPQLNTDWIKSFNPIEVEVRTPSRSGWRQFSINGDEIIERRHAG
jgi:hypothetical protein